jgi:PAS domain S-box-containing protein
MGSGGMLEAAQVDDDVGLRSWSSDSADTARLPATLLDAARDHHYLLDRDKRFRFASASALRDLGLSSGDLVGRSWSEAGLPAAMTAPLASQLDGVLRTGEGVTIETDFPTAGGTRRLEHRIDPSRAADGSVEGLVIVSRDVTGRPPADGAVPEREARLQARIEQRDMLLAELNHRAKNNLQLVASLLKLEAMESGEPAALRLVEQTNQRVAAIAQVHAALYQGDLTGRLELGAYLRDLCGQLAASFLENEGGGRFTLEAEALLPLHIEADRAIPLGLIVNELVVKAFKRGLVHGGEGTVWVRLQPTADGSWRLEVVDGRRQPDGSPISAEPVPVGIGMQLVEGFVRQLRGTLRVEREPCWRAVVDFAV